MSWIKIDTKITNHWLWQDPERLKWWLDLLFMASWKDKQVLHDSRLINLQRGQMIASVPFLMARWEKSKPTIIKYLRCFEEEGMISRYTVYRYTHIITICNYDRYQCGEVPSVDPLVYPLNQENISSKVNLSKNEVTDSKSNTLSGKKDKDVDPLVYPLFYPLVYPIKEEYNNNNNISTCVRACAREEEFIQAMKCDQVWRELIGMNHHLNKDEPMVLNEWLDKFYLETQCRDLKHRDLSDAKRHFNDWLKKQLQNLKQYANTTADKRRGTEVGATSEKDYSTSF